MYRITSVFCGLLLLGKSLMAQQQYELNSGWQCNIASSVKANGEQLSDFTFALSNWQPATVPGTVLTTLINNNQVPDPMYGMNNEKIPDIWNTGNAHYTYWFVKDFKESVAGTGQVWLHLRGVNDGCDVYLNGHKLNANRHFGAYLRQKYNITPFISKNGNNRLAVIVYPPVNPSNPNGGQGGDGTIAKGVGPQYTAGWDWIQPMRDRNTGIWDKVFIEKTGIISLSDPHIVTRVPGVRKPDTDQQPATVLAATTLTNNSSAAVSGTIKYTLDGNTVSAKVTIPAKGNVTVSLPQLQLQHPRLWWPAGYGEQSLYQSFFSFTDAAGKLQDIDSVQVGVREIQTYWNTHTNSREVAVNGQKIFIKGGNWITSDALFRFSKERYDAEVRFHRDMNLNLIRIWGGSLTERPEFFEACDKYGLLVFQDFWMSGDCNGRWTDPMKKEDQWTRRQYPDDHGLFIESVADQVKMLRNHPSLAFWCGGNEITPPADILSAMKDSIIPKLDGTRYFFDYSNSDSMSYNHIGGNGDGPYGIQPISVFWGERTFPFNSEVGSVGVGDYVSLARFLSEENLVAPDAAKGKIDAVWNYHKYIAYGKHVAPYGETKDLKEWADKAQLVNYDQYRALMEGFSAHMWDWYTGVIIWKTQNPWTALRGQMYDYYLDPNACLYGNRKGGEPLHIMYNPLDGMVIGVNNTFSYERDMILELRTYDHTGKDSLLTKVFIELGPTSVQKIMSVSSTIDKLKEKDGIFFSLRLVRKTGIVADNFYWLPNKEGQYSGINKLPAAALQCVAKRTAKDKVVVTFTNPAGGPVAFFNRVSLVDTKGQRILPVFYSDNYLSVLPGETQTIEISGDEVSKHADASVEVYGQNVKQQLISIK